MTLAQSLVSWFALGLALVVAMVAGPGAWSASGCASPSKPTGFAAAIVELVSDGDTVTLRFPAGRRERTRLIGIDAPESHGGEKPTRDVQRSGRDRARNSALQREATSATRPLLPAGTRLEVEQDVHARDRYSRLLALAQRRRILFTMLTVLTFRYPSGREAALVPPLRAWLSGWPGVGRIALGMARQGFDLQLTRYDSGDGPRF